MASLVMAILWIVVAAFSPVLPTRVQRPAVWVLAAIGVPILGYVTYQTGPVMGFGVLALGMSALRWPLIRFSQRLLGGIRRGPQ